jgi:hypothetical protein
VVAEGPTGVADPDFVAVAVPLEAAVEEPVPVAT